jgi:hypothetical protein
MLKAPMVALFAIFSAAAQTVTINVHTDQPGIAIPSDFLGFSFSIGDLAATDGLHFDIPPYQRMVAQLAPGWLRFGGTPVDTTAWQRGARTASTPHNTLVSGDVDRALGFARVTGFHEVLFGLNLATGTPATAADEAAYLYQSGSDVMYGLELGNEPDLFVPQGLLPAGYTVSDYISEYTTFANAIQAETPKAVLTGPAVTSYSIDTWIAPFAQQMGPRIALITLHLYPLIEGSATIAELLGPSIQQKANTGGADLRGIALGANRPWRMAETNSVNDGGQDGLSNVFASALWAVDYMFTLAGQSATGVNFEGGGTGNYTVIAPGANNTATPRPLYYAMLLFRAAARGRLVPLDLKTNGINLTAYGALDTDATLRVTVVNKDLSHDAAVQITPGGHYASATIMRLTAPSIDALTGTTLAGAQVAADGSWTPVEQETVAAAGGVFASTVPSGSAALFTFAGGSFRRPLHGRPRVRP